MLSSLVERIKSEKYAKGIPRALSPTSSTEEVRIEKCLAEVQCDCSSRRADPAALTFTYAECGREASSQGFRSVSQINIKLGV